MSDSPQNKAVREQVLKLIERKELLENEIAELSKILAKNNVGMADPLVDNEGFPLSNIDIYQVRHARHVLICKQNDYKNAMREIEAGISEYYKDNVLNDVNGSATALGGLAVSKNEQQPEKSEYLTPFAVINVVHPGSPADSAGIKNGDLLVEFGSINADNFRSIEDIGVIVQHSHGNAINVKVKRSERFQHVHVIPREWDGRGLLGCNVIPV